MALLDEDLTGEAFMSPRIRASLGVVGLWMLIVGGILTLLFAVVSLFMVYFVYEAANSSYSRAYELGTSLVMLLLSVLGVYTGMILSQGGGGLRKYIKEKDQKALEVSFDKQKVFWTIIGVMSVLYALGMIFLLVALLIDYLD